MIPDKFRCAARRLFAQCILLFALLAGPALAHSWYPHECCSDRDCHPVPVEHVKTVVGGWLLKDGTFIPFGDGRPSPDGRYHICRYDDGRGAMIRMPGKPACFWAPMGAS